MWIGRLTTKAFVHVICPRIASLDQLRKVLSDISVYESKRYEFMQSIHVALKDLKLKMKLNAHCSEPTLQQMRRAAQ